MNTAKKKSVFAVCDTEMEYARNFMEYLNQKRNIPFEVHAFSSAEMFLEFAKNNETEILLISDKAMKEEIRRYPIRQIIILSEGVHSPVLDQYPAVYKYQSSEKVIREVMACYGVENGVDTSPALLPKKEMRIIGTTDKHGTKVTFKPDPEMFDTLEYDYETLHTRMREQAFLNAGLHITIRDERIESADKPEKDRMDSMCYEGGIREFVRWYNRHKTPIHEQVIYMSGSKGDDTAEVALQYNDSFNSNIVSFANDIHTPEGGMHEEGFKRALTNVLNAYGVKKGYIKGDDKVTGDDVREGLTAIVSVKLTEAQFEGQTKAKLGNASMRTLVSNIVTQQLTEFLEENPAVGKLILDKAMMANRAREAARKAREAIRRKTGLESGQMPDKLRDCNDTDPTLTELYIVEGDSAGGSATQGRDSRFQAILPLWGKMLNVEKARADKVYGNDKLQPVITALGAGIGDEFNLDKLRYHKVIIMADADVDGSHIRTLLLTFFFRFMRPLIEHGYVYSAVPPLYKLSRGKTQRVAYSDPERDQISAEMRADNPNAKVDISRYKGLGEMNPHELWETTMDPTTRTLRRITLEDAVQADQIFTVLMGEDVEPRKEFIEENAKYVVNLDI